MARGAKEWVFDTLTTMLGVVIGGSVLFLGMHGASYLPKLEGSLFPVVTASPINVSSLYRDDVKACFKLHLKKLRRGTPIDYRFSIEARLAEHLPVIVYMVDDDLNPKTSDLETHPVGTEWTRHYCFEMPATVPSWHTIRVSGDAIHDTHPLWLTDSPIPSFEICAIGKGLNGGCEEPEAAQTGPK